MLLSELRVVETIGALVRGDIDLRQLLVLRMKLQRAIRSAKLGNFRAPNEFERPNEHLLRDIDAFDMENRASVDFNMKFMVPEREQSKTVAKDRFVELLLRDYDDYLELIH